MLLNLDKGEYPGHGICIIAASTSTMHLRKIVLGSSVFSLLLFSCKKENDITIGPPAPPDEQTCVQATGFNNGDIIPGQYIVAYDPENIIIEGRSADQLRTESGDVLQRHNISRAQLQATFEGGTGGFIATLSDAQVIELKRDDAIGMIEPDRVIALANCFTVASPRLVTWNISRVGYGNGIGKTAWIIDSGIEFNHPDLTVDVARSKSFLPNITSAEDENGHGTHVAGIIGGNNNSIGVLGVASGANLVSLRVLDKEGEGTLSAIIQALGYINANGRPGDVVNMSLGESESSAIFIQQVQNTASKGIYFAIAAGNDSKAANTVSPANANGPNIYTVTAIDSTDNFASFSNYGNDVVDFAAPGVRILSTYTEGRYAYMSGTSMAAPHVAGLLLLRGNAITSNGTAKNDPDPVPDPIAHY